MLCERVMKVEPLLDKCESNEDTSLCSHEIPLSAENTFVPKSNIQSSSTLQAHCLKQDRREKNFVTVDPSYLETLSHAHSGWIFGAIAELVDNSRDAKAAK